MTSLGFENYAEALKIYLSKYREVSSSGHGSSRNLSSFGCSPRTTPTLRGHLPEHVYEQHPGLMNADSIGQGGQPATAGQWVRTIRRAGRRRQRQR